MFIYFHVMRNTFDLSPLTVLKQYIIILPTPGEKFDCNTWLQEIQP